MRTPSRAKLFGLGAAAATLLGLAAAVLPAQSVEPGFVPVTEAALLNPDPDDWLMWRRTLDLWGYSPLKQIDAGNVQQLRLVWSRGLEAGTQEGTPLVHDGVMYFPNPQGVIQAIDAVTGDLLWEHRRKAPDDLGKYILGPYVNRNLAIYGTLIFDHSADGYVYALDARTGKEAWASQIIDYRTGVHQTSGPIIADGKVITGRACDPTPLSSPEPCVITAHDPLTGRELWRTRTIPGPGEPGNETWGDVPFAERKHVGTWIPPSYDPELKLLFIGTSVTSPAPKFLLAGNDQKHLYHNCTLAIDVKTGRIVWYYQHLVDHWDFDHVFERILLDTQLAPDRSAVRWISPDIKAGEVYKVVTGIPGKSGIVYTLDRRTGKFLWATPTVRQNVVDSIDGRTGAVRVNPAVTYTKKGDKAELCPGIAGGKNWPTGAYSPLTDAMYFPLLNACAETEVTIASRSENSVYGFGGRNKLAPGTQNLGAIHAISPRTGRTLWKYEQRAGMMALFTSGGGLLFGGDLAGRFRAFDQLTGKVLWETNLGSQVTGFPMTYAVNGRQYVAVSTGKSLGTSMYLTLTPEIRPSESYNVFVFALPEQPATAQGSRSPVPVVTPQVAAAAPAVAAAAPAKCAHPGRGSPARAGTLDGAYTAAQSASGRRIYTAQQCATCHGATMQGSAVGPSLVGEEFLKTWRRDTLGALSACIQTTMPPGAAGRLSATDYRDLAAAILDANGIKAD
jgi:PQQ-dependent dehydrogenase (methanol/ethanol family)